MTTETEHLHSDALTVTETALLLNVSTRTVWRYLRSGRLTALRHPMNRRVYTCENEVRAVHHATQDAYRARYAERPVAHRE